MRDFREPTANFFTTDNNIVIATIFYHNCRYVGKAKCSPEDEFDYEFGKKLAYNRALNKWFTAKKKFLMKKIYDCGVVIDTLSIDRLALIKAYNEVCREYWKRFEN